METKEAAAGGFCSLTPKRERDEILVVFFQRRRKEFML